MLRKFSKWIIIPLGILWIAGGGLRESINKGKICIKTHGGFGFK